MSSIFKIDNIVAASVLGLSNPTVFAISTDIYNENTLSLEI